MRIIATLILVMAMALPVKAQQNEIRSVISSQINSFLKDDFAKAFSHAAPNVKQIFQTPERFAQMVTQGYPMVHRPAQFDFQSLNEVAGVQVQDVLILDRLGTYFMAQYTMVQINGVWQISGVSIEKTDGVGA